MTYEEYKKIATVEISAEEYRYYVEPVYMGTIITKEHCACLYDAVKIWERLKKEAEDSANIDSAMSEIMVLERDISKKRDSLDIDRNNHFIIEAANKEAVLRYFKSKEVVK